MHFCFYSHAHDVLYPVTGSLYLRVFIFPCGYIAFLQWCMSMYITQGRYRKINYI